MNRGVSVRKCGVLSILIVSIASFSLAADHAFIKFEGLDGGSLDSLHNRWCDLVSFDQSIYRKASATGPSRRSVGADLKDIVVIKTLDKASPKLAEAVCNGKVFPKVEIHLTTSNKTYFAYELQNVQVTAYSVSNSASPTDPPIEKVSLKFEKIKVVYTEFDASGRPKGTTVYEWDVR